MEKLMLIPALEALQENAKKIRQKFTANYKVFVSEKENPLAVALLGIFCNGKVQAVVSDKEFGQVLEAVFGDGKRELSSLCKYCDMLTRTLNCVKTKAHTDALAERYDKHLQGNLIPRFKKLVSNTKSVPNQDEIWAYLVDIYKFSTALYAYYTGSVFCMSVTRKDMNEIENTLRSNDIAAKQPAHFLKQPINSIDPYRREERQYAILISWILIEMICEQDGLNREERA